MRNCSAGHAVPELRLPMTPSPSTTCAGRDGSVGGAGAPWSLNAIFEAATVVSPVLEPVNATFVPILMLPQVPPSNCVDAFTAMLYVLIMKVSDGHDVEPTK